MYMYKEAVSPVPLPWIAPRGVWRGTLFHAGFSSTVAQARPVYLPTLDSHGTGVNTQCNVQPTAGIVDAVRMVCNNWEEIPVLPSFWSAGEYKVQPYSCAFMCTCMEHSCDVQAPRWLRGHYASNLILCPRAVVRYPHLFSCAAIKTHQQDFVNEGRLRAIVVLVVLGCYLTLNTQASCSGIVCARGSGLGQNFQWTVCAESPSL